MSGIAFDSPQEFRILVVDDEPDIAAVTKLSLKGMRYRDIIDAILSVGRTSAPILVLLITAALYSRTLAMTGMANAIEGVFIGSGLEPWMIITSYPR